MKLSVSSSIQKRIKMLRLDADGFPMVLIDDYRPAWKKFLKSTVVKDLSKYKPLGNLYICSAFVSYISTIDSDCWRRSSVNIVDVNDITVKNQYSNLRTYLRKYFDAMVSVRNGAEVEFKDNDFIRAAVDPVFTGYFVCAPKNSTLDDYIKSHVPAPFKTFPEEFKKAVSVTTLLSSKIGWVPLITDELTELYVGRAKPNYLVFKYTLRTKNVLFYGTSTAANMQKYLESLIEKL